MSNDGQVSETSMMSTQGGADGTPGTDDGIPEASATQHRAQGAPADYREGEGDADEPTVGS